MQGKEGVLLSLPKWQHQLCNVFQAMVILVNGYQISDCPWITGEQVKLSVTPLLTSLSSMSGGVAGSLLASRGLRVTVMDMAELNMREPWLSLSSMSALASGS